MHAEEVLLVALMPRLLGDRAFIAAAIDGDGALGAKRHGGIAQHGGLRPESKGRDAAPKGDDGEEQKNPRMRFGIGEKCGAFAAAVAGPGAETLCSSTSGAERIRAHGRWRRPAHVRVVERLKDVTEAAWDACAGSNNPFVAYAFLEALEASRSATSRTGWLPQHLLIEDETGRLLGAAPMYLKSHS